MIPVTGLNSDFSTSDTEHYPSKKRRSITLTNEKQITLTYWPTPMHGPSTQEDHEEVEVLSESEGNIKTVMEEERSPAPPQVPQRRLTKELPSTTNPAEAKDSILMTVRAELTSLQRKKQIPSVSKLKCFRDSFIKFPVILTY